jgi:hypothetical protein
MKIILITKIKNRTRRIKGIIIKGKVLPGYILNKKQIPMVY